jgi:hypothetical protein
VQHRWYECEWVGRKSGSGWNVINRAATFVGDGHPHIAALTVPMEVVHSEIKSKSVVSTDPAYTDQYVLQALMGRCFEPSSLCKEKELREAIQAIKLRYYATTLVSIMKLKSTR